MSGSGKSIEVSVEGAIATVLLSRPARANTINLQLTVEFNDALDALDRDPEVACVLVSGSGDKHFCGGADLREIDKMLSSDGRVVGDPRRDFIRHIEEVSKPVIAVINGAAMGGGCEIALACDFRIMAADTTIGLPEIRFGALPGGGGTQRLPRIVGLGKAKELILTGKAVSAEEALAIGLVHRVVARASLSAAAQDFAMQFVDLAPYAVSAGKLLLNQALDLPISEGLQLEQSVTRDMGSHVQRAQYRERSMQKSAVYAGIFSSKVGESD